MIANPNFEFVDIIIGRQIISGRIVTASENLELAIIIHPATGVQQKYYLNFAFWLAKEFNAAVLLYDYRGMGMSRGAEPLYDIKVKLSDWGIHDQNSALEFMCNEYPDIPIWVIGHSLGGLFLRWHKNIKRVERFITVCSGPAYFLKHPISYMPSVIWFWFIGGPLLTKLYGYLPGRLSGLGADLPKEVYWEWRKFCLSKSFYKNNLGPNLTIPKPLPETVKMTAISVLDDTTISPKMVSEIQYLYESTEIKFRQITPLEINSRSIGHLSIFSKRNRLAWPLIIN